MALTSRGSISPDNSATGVYGSPANATRMNRETNTEAVAAEYTTGSGATSAIGEAFLYGNSLGKAKPTAGKQSSAGISGELVAFLVCLVAHTPDGLPSAPAKGPTRVTK
jgi:hypothetical protein